MLAQVIDKSLRVYAKEFTISTVIPFGTVVFVASIDKPFGNAMIIYQDVIYKVSFRSLEPLESEKDLLTWNDILKREEQKKQKIIETIENLVVE